MNPSKRVSVPVSSETELECPWEAVSISYQDAGVKQGCRGGLVAFLQTARGGPDSPRSERHLTCFRAWCEEFFQWYNGEHYRAGLGDLNSNQRFMVLHASVLVQQGYFRPGVWRIVG